MFIANYLLAFSLSIDVVSAFPFFFVSDLVMGPDKRAHSLDVDGNSYVL